MNRASSLLFWPLWNERKMAFIIILKIKLTFFDVFEWFYSLHWMNKLFSESAFSKLRCCVCLFVCVWTHTFFESKEMKTEKQNEKWICITEVCKIQEHIWDRESVTKRSKTDYFPLNLFLLHTKDSLNGNHEQ